LARKLLLGYAANETVTAAEAGTVCLLVGTAGYRGAATKSNNTAELTALLRAVEGELARWRSARTDSKYALGHASGKWLVPRKNTELVRRLRERVTELVRQRGGPKYVTVRDVRAHARTPGNEAADQLAKEVWHGTEPCQMTRCAH
jgi:ribonuclease HI